MKNQAEDLAPRVGNVVLSVTSEARTGEAHTEIIAEAARILQAHAARLRRTAILLLRLNAFRTPGRSVSSFRRATCPCRFRRLLPEDEVIKPLGVFTFVVFALVWCYDRSHEATFQHSERDLCAAQSGVNGKVFDPRTQKHFPSRQGAPSVRDFPIRRGCVAPPGLGSSGLSRITVRTR